MTLDEIIKLFEEIENGKEGQKIGFHLHEAIRTATTTYWHTNQNYSDHFSGFLKALKDSELPSQN